MLRNDLKSLITMKLQDGYAHRTGDIRRCVEVEYCHYSNNQWSAAWRDLLRKNVIIRIDKGVYQLNNNSNLINLTKAIVSNAVKDIDKIRTKIDAFSLLPEDLKAINIVKQTMKELQEIENKLETYKPVKEELDET